MRRLIGLVTLAILLVVYLTTLQTIPNGSEHYYMIDVGETQNVLNQWGTLHATGYPLYVMVGNVLVAGMRLLGVSAATAPGAASLLYGMIALGLLYVLAAHVVEPSPQPSPVNEGESGQAGGAHVVEPPPQPSPVNEGGSGAEGAKAGGSQTLPYEGQGKAAVGFGARYRHLFLAGGMVLVFGLTRTVWVHNSIAEVYSFGLMILAGLFLLALWRAPIRGRVYWLALLGGIGAFHHRAIAMAAPALVYAVWGELVRTQTPPPSPLPAGKEGERTVSGGRYWSVVQRISICLVLGLLGFAQYVYLPLRAQAGALWVYGEPGTWNGFWDQFLGREASRFIGTPGTSAALVANFNLINTVLVTDVTAVGLVLGVAGLVVGLLTPARRKVAITMVLSGGVAYGFHVLFYTDILSALILPVTLALAFGWLLLAEWIWNAIEPQSRRDRGESLHNQGRIRPVVMAGVVTAVVLGGAGYLVAQNWPFIHEMTTNPTGLETIELAKETPDGAVLMLDWGPRYYAVAFAQDLMGELPKVTLVTHKADFNTLVNIDRRQLVTADFTFYNRSVNWWEEKLGKPVYVEAAGAHLVAINVLPRSANGGVTTGIEARNQAVICRTTTIELQVDWETASVPDHDLSVYVHLLDKDGVMIGQADESAPVYGLRPLTSWTVDAMVHDVYALPRLPNADHIEFGLYRQLPSGEFQNEYTFNAAVKCDE